MPNTLMMEISAPQEWELLFPKGTVVRMSRAYRTKMRWANMRVGKSKQYHSRRHIREFGRCWGKVLGPVDWGNGTVGPELNVRWFGVGNLRYAYHPEHLDIVFPAPKRG